MKSKLSIFITFAVLALLISGCGGDGAGYPTDSELKTTEATSSTGETSETADSGDEKPGKTPKVTGSVGDKPEIAEPSGTPPDELVIKDLKEGTGKEAKAGDEVTVNYVGVAWSTGTEFDTSFGKEPFKFALGEGAVIKGWDEGFAGMKVGGRRELIIPPDLGYGETGSGSSIGPNETLIFVVDLLKVS